MFSGPSKKGKTELIAPKSLVNYLFTEQQIEAYMRQQQEMEITNRM